MIKEIDFTDVNCKHTLVTALTFYGDNFDFKKSKEWALVWVKENMPDEYDSLKSVSETSFSNRGFVCRMMKNGLTLTSDQYTSLVNFFKGLAVKNPVVESDDPLPVKSVRKASKVNTVIFQLEDVIDAILSDSDIPQINISTEKSILDESMEWIEAQIIEAHEQMLKQEAIIKQLESAHLRCGGVKESILKTRKPVVKDTKSDITTDKASAAKTMKYMKKDDTLGLVSMSPAKLVGAKEALLYNVKRRQVIRYVAEAGLTLTVSHSSVRNIDPNKSTCKIIRKPNEFFAISNLWQAYELIKTTPRSPGTHVSEDVIIIDVK